MHSQYFEEREWRHCPPRARDSPDAVRIPRRPGRVPCVSCLAALEAGELFHPAPPGRHHALSPIRSVRPFYLVLYSSPRKTLRKPLICIIVLDITEEKIGRAHV